jgi:hypothetical protein
MSQPTVLRSAPPERVARLSPRLAPLLVPSGVLARSFKIPSSHRDRGMHWVASSGSGKSLALGFIAFLDFLRRTPQVLFDPTGPMIDAFLFRVARAPAPMRRFLWSHIRYVDMSGRNGCVAPWPLLFEYPGDSRKDVADRFLKTCRAIDPHLQSASILGYNALVRVGRPVGQILSSLGLQLDSAPDLLDHPKAWLERLNEAEQRFPEVHEAAEFFRHQYIPLSDRERLALSGSYRTKLESILSGPTLRATMCTQPAAIDFDQVVRQRQTVLLDFRHETNELDRVLKTRWAYDCLLAYVRHRGPGRHRPLAIHIDEITELTNQGSLDQQLFTSDLDYLFNVLQRNYSLWITAAHQQMWQLSKGTQETLLALGTQYFGQISDMETAEALAHRYRNLNPYRVKRWENVWMSGIERPFVVEQKPVYFPMEEQTYLAARDFLERDTFWFYVKPRDQHRLLSVSLASYMGPPWPNEYPDTLEQIRYRLALSTAAPHEAPPVTAPLLPPNGDQPSVTMQELDDHEPDIDDSEQLEQEYWETDAPE